MRFLIATALMVALLATVGAESAKAVSQAGGISLQFPIGSRYNALGEAGTALSTDLSSIWWNLGGFAFAGDAGNDNGIHFMYSKLAAGLADDVSLNWLGYGHYIPGWGMVGVTLTYLDQGEQNATGEDGEDRGTFNAYQFAGSLAYGAKLANNVGAGISVKYFRDELAPDSVTQDQDSGSGSTWGVDMGVHYRPVNVLALGLSVTNIGPDITFVDADQSDPLPFTLRLGAAWEAWRTPLTSVTIITDYLISLVQDDETKVLGVGVEWGYVESLFVRGGRKADPEGDIEDWTWGFGVDLQRWTKQAVSFDYANVPQASGLDSVDRFSLTFDF